MSFLQWTLTHGHYVWHVTLTGSPASDGRLLTQHHKELRRRFERRFKVKLVFYQSQTDEGPQGVIHTLWAFQQPEPGNKVAHAWLSQEWERLHGAYIVWLTPVEGRRRGRKLSRKKAAWYMAQYTSDQHGKLRHISWSWWDLPIALAAGWETLKRLASESYQDEGFHWHREFVYTMAEVVAAWEHLLESGGAMLGDTVLEVRGRNVVEVF